MEAETKAVKRDDEKEMSFLEHLEEFRWHIIRSLASIFIFSITAFLMKDFVFGTVIFGPSRPDFWTYEKLCLAAEYLKRSGLCIDELPFIVQSRKMTGQFSMHVTSSFVIGLIVAFPYAFWEMWRFIKPGLYSNEKKLARGATFFVSMLFLIGVLFGYFIISPLSINFLANYQVDPRVTNEFDITSYVNILVMIVLASGILFQLPIIVYFLTKAGLVSPTLLRHYRRHAIVVILVLSAFLTPPDPISQILIAIPLLVLYEVSIFISKFVVRKEESSMKLTNQ